MKSNIDLKGKCVLVTGAAGFIGANLVLKLLKEVESIKVVGLDNINDYYDTSIKDYRLKLIEAEAKGDDNWVFVKGSIADKALVDKLFKEYNFDVESVILKNQYIQNQIVQA